MHMKLPIIEGKEVVPVRFIPFITHGIYGRKIIAGILAHQLKPNCFPLDTHYSQNTAEIEAVIAEMKVVRHPRNNNDGTASVTHTSPLVEVLCVDSKEEPFDENTSPGEWEREELFYAHRLNGEGKPESIPTEKWRTVLWDMEPIIQSAHREEDEIGIRGAKRKEWHVNTLKLIPANSFLWKEDFERIWQARLDSYSVHDDDMLVTIDYGVDIENEDPSKPLVQEAFDRLNAVSKMTESVHAIATHRATTATKLNNEQAKENKAATAADISKKMSALKKGKIKANSKAVDKLLATYCQMTKKNVADHNDFLRHMREHPTQYPLAGFGKDGDVDRYFWLKVSSGAAKEHFSKKKIVRKIVDRLKNNEYLTKEPLVEKNM